MAFQLMVGAGFAMMAVAAIALWLGRRPEELEKRRWLLRLLVASAPLGFLALEAGWIVTEVGRQPWIIYNVMRTKDALTPMPGLVVPFLGFPALYFLLAVVVVVALLRQIGHSPFIPAAGQGDTGSDDAA